MGKEPVPLSRVVAPKALRHQDFDRFLQHFSTRVAKQRLRLRIYEHDLAALVDGDYGIRRSLE
jgi:hypothetical protein